MLEYEWGNPQATMMLTGNEGGATSDSDQSNRQFFDHYTLLPEHFLSQPQPGPTPTTTNMAYFSHHSHDHNHPHHQFNPQAHHSFFDPRAFTGVSSTSYPPPPPPLPPTPSMLSLDPLPPVNSTHCGPGLLLVPKSEDVGRPMDFTGSRIGLGLNLGGRTYFSSSEEYDFVNRLYRRSRPAEPGSTITSNSPRCQAQGCNADLSDAKHYHRRHKVCEFHSKAATVIAAGLTQRFCQQCSRFHLLSEFDNGKRSCRKRLADHNRRRRKTQQQPNQEIHNSQPAVDSVARSPPDYGAQSSSSVTVAVSPPDYFRLRPY